MQIKINKLGKNIPIFTKFNNFPPNILQFFVKIIQIQLSDKKFTENLKNLKIQLSAQNRTNFAIFFKFVR